MAKKTHRVKQGGPTADTPRVTLRTMAGATVIVTLVAALEGYAGFMVSASEGRASFPVRLVFFLLFESTYGPLIAALLLPATRALARRLPAAVLPEQGSVTWEMSSAEEAQHDSSLSWPLSLSDLPDAWVRFVRERKKEAPFFLNHVTPFSCCLAPVRACDATSEMFTFACSLRTLDRCEAAIVLCASFWSDQAVAEPYVILYASFLCAPPSGAAKPPSETRAALAVLPAAGRLV